MQIRTGQLAPPLTGTTWRGEPIDLEDFRGQKVWVGFYRWAACPLCNMRIKEVIERAAAFEEAGIQLIAVFQSSAEDIANHVATQDPPFPIIADPDMLLYERYGVQVSWWGTMYPRVIARSIQGILNGFFSLNINGPIARIPADFLVDPEGLVWRSYYGRAVSDHIPFEDIDAFGADLCLDMPRDRVT